MISFRTQNDSTASVILILAILLLAGTGVWASRPLPNAAMGAKSQTNKISEAQIATSDTAKKNAQIEADMAPLLWEKKVEEIGPEAYAIVAKFAIARHVKIVAFRPQKAIDAQGLTQLPFAISVDGAYLNTVQLVKDLETKDTKLAVSASSVSAADSATDHITGTINIVAYLKTPAPASVKPAPKGSNAQKS